MRALLGLLFGLAGAAAGLYVGGYLLFIGGLAEVINGFRYGLPTAVIVWGIIKVFLAGTVGWGLFFLGMSIGAGINEDL